MTKEVRQFNRAYKNRFDYLQKSIFANKGSGLELFVEYLKYLRDSLILNEFGKEYKGSEVKMASIIAATAEFDAYKQTQDSQQKTFHWNNFCELLKQNMEDWLKIDDSV